MACVLASVGGLNLEKFPLYDLKNARILHSTSQFIWACFTIEGVGFV